MGQAFAKERLMTVEEYLAFEEKSEHYIRQPDDTWKLIEYIKSNEKIIFGSIDCMLTLTEIYRRVDFPPIKLVKIKKDKNGK